MTKATKANKATILAAAVAVAVAAGAEIIQSAAPAATAAPVVATKADKARAIFADCYKDPNAVPQRKDIIQRMVAEAGLTKAGAATYLQNMKGKAGLVTKKAPVVVAAAEPAMA